MSDPQELVEAALAAATSDGCVVVVADHTETNLRFAANALTTNGQMAGRSVTVVSTVDGATGTSVGVVTRGISTVDEIADLVRAAEAAGRDADPAEDAAPLVEPYDHDDSWDAPAAATSVEVFDDLATSLGTVMRQWRTSDRLLYGFAEHELTSYFLGTSTGLRRRVDQPSGRLELNGKTADLGGSSWSGQYTVDFADVDVVAATTSLAERLGWGRRRIELEPGRYETLLPPTSVADLMIYAYWSASARDAEEGRSAFTGRVGHRVSDLPLRLYSDPAAPGMTCPPFEIATSSSAGMQSVFDNGTPLAATSWIADGSVAELIRTRAWARQTGQQPRPAIDNLALESAGATGTLEQLIADTERALLVTSMWYIREVDPQNLLLTGLTRDGVYLVENGQVQGQVNNFRWNESPLDLLGRISQVGASTSALSREWSDYFRRTSMPSVRIPDFNMSTVSPAS